MLTGQGNIGVLSLPRPAGAPFAAGSAVNGVSLDGSGRIVLGNDGGGTDAALLNSREIPLAGNAIILTTPFSTAVTNLLGSSIELTDSAGSSQGIFARLVPGVDTTLQISGDAASGALPQMIFDTGNSAESLYIQNSAGTTYWQFDPNGPAGINFFSADNLGNVSLGVVGSVGPVSGIRMNLRDAAQVVDIERGSGPHVTGLKLDFGNMLFQFGDVNANVNGTKVAVNDGLQNIDFTCTSLSVNGTPGFSGTVTPVVSITVINGLVTAVA